MLDNIKGDKSHTIVAQTLTALDRGARGQKWILGDSRRYGYGHGME